ncbi:MAG: RcpC/CpaB family pilus assembly protein, partial [Actinomycetota bacterium]
RSSGSVPRLALGILLVLLATLGGTRLVHAASRTVEIWAAGKDLAPGKILEAGDVGTVAVRLADAQLRMYAGVDVDPVGATLARSVRTGELFIRTDLLLKEDGSPLRRMTVPVPASHAVLGQIRPGDRADVIATAHKGTPEARSFYVLRGVTVLDVEAGSGGFTGEKDSVGITVGVDSAQALMLAFVIQNAELEVVLVPPGSPDAQTGSIGFDSFLPPAGVTAGAAQP